jgi:hypothetical protein
MVAKGIEWCLGESAMPGRTRISECLGLASSTHHGEIATQCWELGSPVVSAPFGLFPKHLSARFERFAPSQKLYSLRYVDFGGEVRYTLALDIDGQAVESHEKLEHL